MRPILHLLLAASLTILSCSGAAPEDAPDEVAESEQGTDAEGGPRHDRKGTSRGKAQRGEDRGSKEGEKDGDRSGERAGAGSTEGSRGESDPGTENGDPGAQAGSTTKGEG